MSKHEIRPALHFVRSCLIDNAIEYSVLLWHRINTRHYFFKPLGCVVDFSGRHVTKAFPNLDLPLVWATVIQGPIGAGQEVRGGFTDFRELHPLELLALEAPKDRGNSPG